MKTLIFTALLLITSLDVSAAKSKDTRDTHEFCFDLAKFVYEGMLLRQYKTREDVIVYFHGDMSLVNDVFSYEQKQGDERESFSKGYGLNFYKDCLIYKSK